MTSTNRFLSQLDTNPQQASTPLPGAPSSNRFLSQIEGVDFTPKEGILKTTARTLAQPVLGYLKKWTYPLDLIKLATEGASREVLADLIENDPTINKQIAEQARQQGMKYLPTQELAENLIEKYSGAPLEAKNKAQKMLRLAGTGAGFRPGTAVEKTTAAVTAPTVTSGLEAIGVPEPIAEIGGLAVSGGVPAPTFEKVVKPSGLPVRRYESLKEPIKISPKRAEKITETVESDFRKLSDQLLQKNKTYSAMKEDSSFKDKISGLFDKVENLAENIGGEINSENLRNIFKRRYNQREVKGITPNEYEQSFRKEVKKINNQIPIKDISATQLVDQFRKNNASLRELYEPGKSSAFNRGKREALLEYNRSIEDIITNQYPDSEFKKLFEFTNKRWQEMSDIDQIENFTKNIFDGKINYEKARQIFRKDKEHIAKPFKRILGEEGFKNFKTLTEDLLSTQNPMSYIKKAEIAGFKDIATLGAEYLLHPSLAKTHGLLKLGKRAYQMLLDKPRLAITWKNAIDNLKKGNYQQSEKEFKELDKEVKSKK